MVWGLELLREQEVWDLEQLYTSASRKERANMGNTGTVFMFAKVHRRVF